MTDGTIYNGKYKLNYLADERLYVQKAAKALCDFFGACFEAGEDAEVNIYLGKVKAPDDIDQAVTSGYVIVQKGGNLLLRGSNAENTYIAASRYINILMRGDAKNVLDTKKEIFIRYDQPQREEYIKDISKFQTVWQYEWRPPLWMTDYEEKLHAISDKNGRTICYAHRGDMEHYPENSIEGIISAIKKGADLVEVDVYLCADGVPVLNHGTDLEPTTDWKEKNGRVVDGVLLPESKELTSWTYEQLQRLNLRTCNGVYTTVEGEITDYRIPTLTEVFTVCRERIQVLIDKLPQEQWDLVFDIIKETGAYRSFCYTDLARSPEQAMEMKQRVLDAFGVAGPTMWERGMSWSGTWFDEFDLHTDDEFEEYFSKQAARGCYLASNRVCKLVEYINRHFGNKNSR